MVPPLDATLKSDWIRIPPKYLVLFKETPFTHVRSLKFYVFIRPALSLIFDLLPFMPALRSLTVVGNIRENGVLDMPEFPYPSPPLVRLERLVYRSGLGLQTLVTRVISPSAKTLSEVDLYWDRHPRGAPHFPLLPNVRRLLTTCRDDQSIHLIRRCPAVSYLKLHMDTRERLELLVGTLQETGSRVRFLDILRSMDDFDGADADGLVAAVTRLKSLSRMAVLTKANYDASSVDRVRNVCRERRIRFRFLSQDD
ncbi:hypothetical protein AURDEDRAFT_164947 [Auricularia subglabra TFB-10046 SS5]|nr:hypothetical protein AURDEDRAFT_164947 [Auricularia subglabra TFB-10046 SS5]